MDGEIAAELTIRPETSGDWDGVYTLHSAAFGGGDEIPNMVADLRATTAPVSTISIVAAHGAGQPLGHVMMSHAALDAPRRLVDVLVLSPLGVHPAVQGKGIGTALVNAAIAAARKTACPLLFLEGSHKYYGSRGFENAMDLGFRRPSLRIPPKAFQVARLTPNHEDLSGTLVYKDVHWRHGVGLYPAA